MLFNSIEFLLFLPIVFVLYWFVFDRKLKYQNLLILFSSYIFYGWWDYRFLSLILLSTIVDYFIGLCISNQASLKNKRILLWCSVLFNLGVLGFFKYYNFFIDSWIDLFSSFGYDIKSVWTLNIILPVGISFYTFQTMSYTIDIYKGKLKPTKDFISFASFVSFFPQLVAGPIERATNLLPQILKKREFKIDKEAYNLILSGFVRKMVFADNFSVYIDNTWLSIDSSNIFTNIFSILLFSFQIYFDFSGYSRIARGVALLFGFNLMENFNYPYKSRSFKEFWSRWHISLSTWFKDYLYIPLGGSQISKLKTTINLVIVFLISGLWHGASINFIVWGGVHSIFIVIERFFRVKTGFILTFIIVNLSWVPFRSPDLAQTIIYFKRLTILPEHFSELFLGLGIINVSFILMLFIFSFFYLKLESEKRDFLYFLNPILIFFLSNINNSFIYFQF